MFLSIIIPAYNEAELIQEVIKTARQAFLDAGFSDFEIIVSDDDSTDDTATLAEGLGANVVRSGKRNIGATRNVGASAAQGEYLLFLDADTFINPPVAKATLKAIGNGAIALGASIRWSENAPIWSTLVMHFWNMLSKLKHWPAGSFFLVKKTEFEKVGGFNEEYYVSEELHLAKELQKIGEIEILRETYQTSPRKVLQFTARDHLRLIWKLIRNPIKTVKNRKELEIWYTRR